MADAGAVGDMQIDGAVVVGSKDGGEGAGAEGELLSKPPGVVFHAIEQRGVLIEEGEENGGGCGIAEEIPSPRR